eukprot:4307727-Alexandrium_andersonii.AAC.1
MGGAVGHFPSRARLVALSCTGCWSLRCCLTGPLHGGNCMPDCGRGKCPGMRKLGPSGSLLPSSTATACMVSAIL